MEIPGGEGPGEVKPGVRVKDEQASPVKEGELP